MNINATISISRNSKDMITITIHDRASHARFVELSLTPAYFAMAVTGLAHIDADSAVVRDLDVVGKRKVIEPRSIDCPLPDYGSKEELRAWLREHGKEDGWIVDDYLGSQSSVISRNDVTRLHYKVYRYELAHHTTSQQNKPDHEPR